MNRPVLIGGTVLALVGVGAYVVFKLSNLADKPTNPVGRQMSPEEMSGDTTKIAQEKSIDVVKRLGGSTTENPRAFETQITQASLHNSPLTDADLKEMAGLGALESLDLSGTKITDQGLKSVAAFTFLRTLNLANTNVTGSGLAALHGLTLLRTLSLAESKASDEGLKGLAGVTPVNDLDLTGTAITNAAFPHIGKLAGLETLKLGRTQITGEVVGLLSNLSVRTVDLTSVPLSADDYLKLRAIKIKYQAGPTPGEAAPKMLSGEVGITARGFRTAISDEWLSTLAARGKLEVLVDERSGSRGKSKEKTDGNSSTTRILNLAESKVTDAGLKSLKGQNSFDAIDLKGTGITDAGLKELHSLSRLQMIDLTKTKATDAGVAELRSALPKCQVKR